MRIVIFEPYYESFGGAQKCSFLLVEKLLEYNQEIVLITPSEGKFLKAFAPLAVKKVIVPPPNILDRFGGAYFRFTFVDFIRFGHACILYNIRLSKLLKQLRANIVILNTPRAVALAGLAPKIANIPSILYFHGHKDEWRTIAGLFRYAIAFIPTKIVSDSQAALASIGSASLTQGKSYVVYNWLESEFEQASKNPIFSKGGMDNNHKFIIGTLANILPRKGQHVLVDAAFRLWQMGIQNWEIRIAGKVYNQAYYEKLTQTIRKCGIEEFIKFVGYVNPQQFLNEIDIFVLSSFSEGHPRCILEAMAMGKAVVTTNVEGISETIKNGVSGYIVPLGNSDLIAEKLNHLLLNTYLVQTLGNNARRLVREKFVSHIQFPAFLRIIKDAATKPKSLG